VKQAYSTQNPRGFEKMTQMPTLSNEGDVVVLADHNLQVMDEVTYSGEWHHPLLNATAGVSLERISFLAASNDPKNWHSAAKSLGYATPAYRNSQVALYDSSGLEVDIQPRFFTPDNDGYNDNLHIQYSLKDPGYQANILIFNDHGQRVRVLVNNDLCGSSGSYFWDGCDDLRQLCNTGYYIIYIRMINTAGMVKTFKKAVALGVL
jgi:hypothetical protein